jgi:hypothetical protein
MAFYAAIVWFYVPYKSSIRTDYMVATTRLQVTIFFHFTAFEAAVLSLM